MLGHILEPTAVMTTSYVMVVVQLRLKNVPKSTNTLTRFDLQNMTSRPYVLRTVCRRVIILASVAKAQYSKRLTVRHRSCLFTIKVSQTSLKRRFLPHDAVLLQ